MKILRKFTAILLIVFFQPTIVVSDEDAPENVAERAIKENEKTQALSTTATQAGVLYEDGDVQDQRVLDGWTSMVTALAANAALLGFDAIVPRTRSSSGRRRRRTDYFPEDIKKARETAKAYLKREATGLFELRETIESIRANREEIEAQLLLDEATPASVYIGHYRMQKEFYESMKTALEQKVNDFQSSITGYQNDAVTKSVTLESRLKSQARSCSDPCSEVWGICRVVDPRDERDSCMNRANRKLPSEEIFNHCMNQAESYHVRKNCESGWPMNNRCDDWRWKGVGEGIVQMWKGGHVDFPETGENLSGTVFHELDSLITEISQNRNVRAAFDAARVGLTTEMDKFMARPGRRKILWEALAAISSESKGVIEGIVTELERRIAILDEILGHNHNGRDITYNDDITQQQQQQQQQQQRRQQQRNNNTTTTTIPPTTPGGSPPPGGGGGGGGGGGTSSPGEGTTVGDNPQERQALGPRPSSKGGGKKAEALQKQKGEIADLVRSLKNSVKTSLNGKGMTSKDILGQLGNGGLLASHKPSAKKEAKSKKAPSTFASKKAPSKKMGGDLFDDFDDDEGPLNSTGALPPVVIDENENVLKRAGGIIEDETGTLSLWEIITHRYKQSAYKKLMALRKKK